MSRLTRDETAEPVSRDQILRRERGQGKNHFPCSAGHEQDWQPCPVDPSLAMCDDNTYIHTYIRRQVARHFTRNGTDQCQNGSSKSLAPRREQPRSTRIVVADLRPAPSATKPTNHAPIRFDQQAQVPQGHTSYKNKEIVTPRSRQLLHVCLQGLQSYDFPFIVSVYSISYRYNYTSILR